MNQGFISYTINITHYKYIKIGISMAKVILEFNTICNKVFTL